MSKMGKLTAKVKAVNRARKLATQLSPLLIERYQPFIGQKILKNDGTLMAKYEKLWNADNDRSLQIYFRRSTFILGWTIRCCELVVDESGSVYHEESFSVGELNNGVLTAMCDPYSGRYDFTPVEITEKRTAYETAQKLADSLKNDLFPFSVC